MIVYTLDKGRLIEYVPFQQLEAGVRMRYGLTTELLQGRMYLIKADSSLSKGAIAIMNLCKLLTPLGMLCNLFSNSLAERIYDWIATRRYRIFGCSDTCFYVRHG